MKLDLSKIKLTLKEVKPKRVKTTTRTKLTKLVNGRVIKKDDNYFVVISYIEYSEHLFGNTNVSEISNNNENITISLTKDSYDIKGIRPIFAKDNDVCIIRNETQMIFGNYNSDNYLPFKDNISVRGWVVKLNDVLHFKFRNVIFQNNNGYNRNNNIDDEELKWFKDIKSGKK